MKIEVSNGEIIDKLTILEIKLEKISDPDKISNIRKEYDILFPLVKSILDLDHPLVQELKSINLSLWLIEDNIRMLEEKSDFGPEFIHTARQVYRINDQRARVKRDINQETNSGLTEEKSYKEY
jgi:hypothetical protein